MPGLSVLIPHYGESILVPQQCVAIPCGWSRIRLALPRLKNSWNYCESLSLRFAEVRGCCFRKCQHMFCHVSFSFRIWIFSKRFLEFPPASEVFCFASSTAWRFSSLKAPLGPGPRLGARSLGQMEAKQIKALVWKNALEDAAWERLLVILAKWEEATSNFRDDLDSKRCSLTWSSGSTGDV